SNSFRSGQSRAALTRSRASDGGGPDIDVGGRRGQGAFGARARATAAAVTRTGLWGALSPTPGATQFFEHVFRHLGIDSRRDSRGDEGTSSLGLVICGSSRATPTEHYSCIHSRSHISPCVASFTRALVCNTSSAVP